MIVDPITIAPDLPISAAQQLMARYRISGVPVTKDGKLVGILTNRDLRFENRFDAPISEVMTKENLVTVPVGTTLEQAEAILHKHRVEKLLVVDDQFILKGLITVKDIQKKLKYPNSAKDSQGRLRVGAAVGATGDFLERAAELVARKVDVIAIDTAHGHSSRVLAAVKTIKSKLPQVQLITGNVATYEGAKELISLGVDGIKVGIGPGSICTTRVVSGAGVPQITAISRMRARLPRRRRTADRRWRHQVLRRHHQGDRRRRGLGDDRELAGRHRRKPRRDDPLSGPHVQDVSRHGLAGRGRARRVPTATRRIPTPRWCPKESKGAWRPRVRSSDLVYQLVGGLRSGMGYCGARNIHELQQNARFLRISPAGLRESHVHDVIITKEAPNYRVE